MCFLEKVKYPLYLLCVRSLIAFMLRTFQPFLALSFNVFISKESLPCQPQIQFQTNNNPLLSADGFVHSN